MELGRGLKQLPGSRAQAIVLVTQLLSQQSKLRCERVLLNQVQTKLKELD